MLKKGITLSIERYSAQDKYILQLTDDNILVELNEPSYKATKLFNGENTLEFIAKQLSLIFDETERNILDDLYEYVNKLNNINLLNYTDE